MDGQTDVGTYEKASSQLRCYLNFDSSAISIHIAAPSQFKFRRYLNFNSGAISIPNPEPSLFQSRDRLYPNSVVVVVVVAPDAQKGV